MPRKQQIAGDILRIGQTLKARWFGSYFPPGCPTSNFILVRALLAPVIIPHLFIYAISRVTQHVQVVYLGNDVFNEINYRHLIGHLLHIISSQANKIPGPWIVTDWETKTSGSKYSLTILSPYKTTINGNILQRGSNFNQSLLTNVKLCYRRNKVTVKLPSSGVETNPEYYFAIYVNCSRVDYSGTFKIGDPKFGITIYKLVAGDILRIGQKLKAKLDGSVPIFLQVILLLVSH
ncbi:hypothetical protein Glove_140g133 [Diversispora epigaea]|uniref:Uncharacterized protein n=1 Tax=Diversispora epigaea TaxID=1348612 RepID=A0A397IZ30_9GLOM|nr:hypothetical protein Glove_140g133 [Diversispora epigaea]